MDKLDKATRIKFSLFVVYWLTFFTPIYSVVLYGNKFKLSISELGAGLFFVIFFLFLIIAVFVSKFKFEAYFNYTYLGVTSSMIIMLLILLFFKSSGSVLRLSWYFQWILIGILLLAHFKEKLVLDGFDLAVTKTKEYSLKTIEFIKEKINNYKEKKNQMSLDKKEENVE